MALFHDAKGVLIMNFIEEKTPKGFLLKIMFDTWQFLAFDKKGSSIYVDKEGRGLLHTVPVIIFVGTTFSVKMEHDREYTMLKIREGKIVVPYKDLHDGKTKYFFIETDKELDAVPARIKLVSSVTEMVRNIDMSIRPEFVVVDDGITPNDVIIIKNRYKVEDVIYIELANNYFLSEKLKIPDMDRVINLNMMSANPVFLARIHLRSMDLSKINQLLLDFELTALDTEYIMHFIQMMLDDADNDEAVQKNMKMLIDLRDSFKFYLALLQKKDEEIRAIISVIEDVKKITPYRTLISKAKSIYPGSDEQILFTEYDNILIDKKEQLQGMVKG
jgi:hypothetical protein